MVDHFHWQKGQAKEGTLAAELHAKGTVSKMMYRQTDLSSQVEKEKSIQEPG